MDADFFLNAKQNQQEKTEATEADAKLFFNAKTRRQINRRTRFGCRLTLLQNPNGISSSSPGLASLRAYPGSNPQKQIPTPTGLHPAGLTGDEPSAADAATKEDGE